jgi:hypothetical protein
MRRDYLHLAAVVDDITLLYVFICDLFCVPLPEMMNQVPWSFRSSFSPSSPPTPAPNATAIEQRGEGMAATEMIFQRIFYFLSD